MFYFETLVDGAFICVMSRVSATGAFLTVALTDL